MAPELPPPPPPSPSAFPTIPDLAATGVQFQDFAEKAGRLPELLGNLGSGFQSVATGMGGFLDSAGKFGSMTDQLLTSMSRMPGTLSTIAAGLGKVNGALGEQYARGISTYGSSFETGIGAVARSTNDLVLKSGDLFNQLASRQGIIASSIGKVGQNFQSNALAANAMVEAMRQGADATGEYAAYFDKIGGPEQLGRMQLLQELMTGMYASALQTGDVKGTEQLTMQLLTLRGALEGTVGAAAAGTQQNRGLSTSMQEVAAGGARSTQQLLGLLQGLRTSSNVQSFATQEAAEKAMAYAASIEAMHKRVGISYGDLGRKSLELAASFQMQGDNALSLLGPLSAMSLRLKDTGLNIEQSTELSKKYIQSMATMTAGQKMYMSELIGGPGGLEGKFNIDLMLKRGQGGELFTKIQDALQEQLGDVLKLEDVEFGGAEAAGERERQLAILRANPLGAGKSDEELSRILDSFAGREIGTDAENIFDPGEELKKYTMEGQIALARMAGPQTFADLAGLQYRTQSIPGGGLAADFIQGNISPEAIATKRDFLSRADMGTVIAGGPKSYEQGLSPDLTRAGLEMGARTLSVGFDAITEAAKGAAGALTDFTSSFNPSGALFGLTETAAPPMPSTMPAAALGLGATTGATTGAPGAASTTTAPGTATEGAANPISFLCGGCHKTFYAHFAELASKVRGMDASGRAAPTK